MNETIRKEIEELSELIYEQAKKLLAYENGAPRIEVDIIKENIRSVYEQLDDLVKSNWKASDTLAEQKIAQEIDEQVDELLNAAESQFEENIEQINQQIKDQETVIEEQSVIEEEEILITEKPDPIIEEAPDTEAYVEPTPKPKEPKPTPITPSKPAIEKPNIGDHLQKKPIKNLATAIGINDKFQFINELFDGSMQIYNKAIKQIEDSNNRDEALRAFNSIAKDGKWDEESAAYLQLFDYVDRRFL